jgi:hypothetical protein
MKMMFFSSGKGVRIRIFTFLLTFREIRISIIFDSINCWSIFSFEIIISISD